MAKSKSTTPALPPRHGGYRAVPTAAKNAAGSTLSASKARKLPKPPTGKGGGSKAAK